MKRILMLGLVLALLASMVVTTAAFAGGMCDGSQARSGTHAQTGGGYGPGDGTGGAGEGTYGPGPYSICQDANDDGVCGKP